MLYVSIAHFLWEVSDCTSAASRRSVRRRGSGFLGSRCDGFNCVRPAAAQSFVELYKIRALRQLQLGGAINAAKYEEIA